MSHQLRPKKASFLSFCSLQSSTDQYGCHMVPVAVLTEINWNHPVRIASTHEPYVANGCCIHRTADIVFLPPQNVLLNLISIEGTLCWYRASNAGKSIGQLQHIHRRVKRFGKGPETRHWGQWEKKNFFCVAVEMEENWETLRFSHPITQGGVLGQGHSFVHTKHSLLIASLYSFSLIDS